MNFGDFIMKDWLEIAKRNETTAIRMHLVKTCILRKIQTKMNIFGRTLKTRYKMIGEKLAYEGK